MNNTTEIMIFDKPFVNDIDVLGKWEYYDIISSIDDFDVDNLKYKDYSRGHKVIYFMPNGQSYWIYDGWTKGFLYTHAGGDEPIVCNKYTLRETRNELYMFLEYYEDTTNGVPEINVLRKVSGKEYNKNEIGRFDDIDLPFIVDKAVLGKWKTVDFVSKINDFDPESKPDFKLYLKSLVFVEDGTAIRMYDDDEWADRWTKGKLIDTSRKTAANYERREISGREYLFVEWRMGNYQFGGCDPEYYVYIRDSA